MFRSAVVVVAFLALAFAQNQGLFTIQPLTLGVSKTGSFSPSTNQANGYNADVYSITIPLNATSWTLGIANTGASTACSYIAFYIRDEAPACNPGAYTSSYLCANGHYEDVYQGSTETHTYSLGYDDDLFNYVQNRTVYISVTRDSSSDYDETCSYAFNVTIPTETCPAGQAAVQLSGSTDGCAAYTDIPMNTAQTVNSQTVGADLYYRVQVPASTGNVNINGWFNSTNGFTIYGKSYQTAYSSEYDCYDYYDTYNSTSGIYYYNLICNVVRPGDFWIFFDASSSYAIGSGEFTVTYTNCNGTTGGYNCNFPVLPLPTALTQPITVTVNSNSSLEYPGYYSSSSSGISWVYYVFPTPTNPAASLNFTATSAAGNAYIALRRNNFPDYYENEDSSEFKSVGTTGSTIGVNFFDYAVAGRMYLGFGCYSTATCTFTVTPGVGAAPVNTVSTTGAVADSTTGEEPTTGSAMTVAFSVILMIAALLF